MINRRNIRIKVMQLLYAIETFKNDNAIANCYPQKMLLAKLEDSRKLLTYILHTITQVAQYAEVDAKNRASKYMPSQEDLSVSIKIAGNTSLWALLDTPDFKEAIDADKLSVTGNEDIVKSLYLQLVATEAYQCYIAEATRNAKEEKKILKFLFADIMLHSEDYVAILENNFDNWDDEGDIIIAAVMQCLEEPTRFSADLNRFLGEDKLSYAKSLLHTVIEKDDYLYSFITPKLKNWDVERIAIIDLILLKMGIAEFLFFETIPCKVTINEYIDIAKEYSTDNSGQFVNGILDNIKTNLEQSGKIQKINFRK